MEEGPVTFMESLRGMLAFGSKKERKEEKMPLTYADEVHEDFTNMVDSESVARASTNCLNRPMFTLKKKMASRGAPKKLKTHYKKKTRPVQKATSIFDDAFKHVTSGDVILISDSKSDSDELNTGVC